MALGMVSEHRRCATADLVDIVDLPSVMEEGDWCLEDEHVVMIGGAAHERANVLDGIAELEAEALEDERPGYG